MNEENAKPTGPDLGSGVALSAFPENGLLVGHVGGDDVLLVRQGEDIFAIAPHCTHYHGPLAEGLVVDGAIHCPWHHACFDLRSGEALRAPAFDPLACWKVEQRDGMVFVREKLPEPKKKSSGAAKPGKIVIAGGGAAGFAAAEMLRRHDYQGEIVMVSDDAAAPVDRPNLSKDYLAGAAPEEWVPLRGSDWYAEKGIDLRLSTKIGAINPRDHQVTLADGGVIAYDRLLLATGAEPIRLAVPGAASSDILTLRSLADCRSIIARAQGGATRVLVIGASFIGLEVAASLRSRGLEVHVVAPESRPLEKVMGPQLGDVIRALHEEKGVHFHLGNTVASFEAGKVTLKDGNTFQADFAVAGVGVKPRLQLAESAGLVLDRGVTVDGYLKTSAPDIYAAGDIARWPDPHSGAAIRVEHWVVAERQGQAAARNMLGLEEAFTAVPFFWSQHYDVSINYVGHAESWDELAVEGDLAGKDGLVRFKRAGRTLAVASVFRDLESLKAEIQMEQAVA